MGFSDRDRAENPLAPRETAWKIEPQQFPFWAHLPVLDVKPGIFHVIRAEKAVGHLARRGQSSGRPRPNTAESAGLHRVGRKLLHLAGGRSQARVWGAGLKEVTRRYALRGRAFRRTPARGRRAGPGTPGATRCRSPVWAGGRSSLLRWRAARSRFLCTSRCNRHGPSPG
jgi:hypothetical protein